MHRANHPAREKVRISAVLINNKVGQSASFTLAEMGAQKRDRLIKTNITR